MRNLNDILKQAQKMQAKLLEAQSKVGGLVVEGVSGGGMVILKLNGKHEIVGLIIDSSLMNPGDATMVCDLIIAAYNDAKKKLDGQIEQDMSGILPSGFKLPF